MENRPGIRKLEEVALIVCFIVAILLPGLGMILKMDTAAASQENRQLSPFPPLSLEADHLVAFPKRFNEYFNDHFGFRSSLISGVAVVKFRWLNVSPSPKVICGKAGWLFYMDEYSLASYRAVQPFSEEQLENWKQVLEGRRRWLAQRNIRYIYIVAPDKHTIYPEYMPYHIGRVGHESRLDQLIRYLKENSEVEVLDLRPALLSAKNRHPVYYKTDTHWNAYGAFTANQEIVRAISQTLPAVQAFQESDFEFMTEQVKGGDLAAMLGLADTLSESTVNLHPRKPFQAMTAGRPLDRNAIRLTTFVSEQNGSNLPRLVMYRDSFANALIPFLGQSFSRAVYVWGDRFETSLINQERPDIVLHEIVERKLMVPPAENDTIIESQAKYEGSHDSAGCRTISGWAWNSAHPNVAVKVDVYVDEKLVATVTAGGFRADLRDAGKGKGYHAFVCMLPEQLADGRPHIVTVRIAGTDITLSNTQRTIVCK